MGQHKPYTDEELTRAIELQTAKRLLDPDNVTRPFVLRCTVCGYERSTRGETGNPPTAFHCRKSMKAIPK